MKKIIGLLVAAIICVGAAFAVNGNNQVTESNQVALNQGNGNTTEKSDIDKDQGNNKKNEGEVSTSDKEDKDSKGQDAEAKVENKDTALNKVTTNVGTESNNVTNNNTNNKEENTTSPNETNKEEVNKEPEKVETVTITINAQKAIDYGILKEDGFGHLPSNGVILGTTTVEIKEGYTVYDVLSQVIRDNKIHMEYTGAGSAIYIQGIDNLYEFDCGKYSGWMYEVNGTYPNYGVGAYNVKAGDRITFNYTCDLGKDLGAPVN